MCSKILTGNQLLQDVGCYIYRKGCVVLMIDNKAVDRLICDIAQGDMSALETLYCELAPGVYAFARSIVKDDAAAQDIMQDTFVRVYNSAASFHARGLGKAWIMQIARNLSLNAVMRTAKNEPEDVIEDRPAGESTEDAAETRLMISAALDALTDAEREVLVLHAVSGLKLDAIAKITGEPLGTVKWRHSQAMKKIRSAMAVGEEAAK